MPTSLLTTVTLLACLCSGAWCQAEEVLFEDTFDKELSEKWQVVGVAKEDYRIRDGALEMRVKPEKRGGGAPMLKVELPFATADTVTASVEVTIVGEPLRRNASAGLVLTDQGGVRFSARKTNIDGYFVFAPGDVDFIGAPGEEGDPANYTVKYWPANAAAGPLRIIVRDHYAHFQVGPSTKGQYKNFFHSAIQEAKKGLGFGLFASGGADDVEQWVRFDNFRVRK